MADSTMPPDEYTDLHRRARQAEEEALSFDSDLRDEVQAARMRIYDREIERGKLAYNRANKKEDQDRYRRAISFFGAAGIAQADSARPVLNEAFSRLRVGQRKEVIPVLEDYVERADTVSRKGYKALGRLYVASGQSRQALDLLNRAIQVYPSDRDLHGLRLTAYNRAGRMAAALETYREQIEKRPNNVLYRYNYGALLLEAERYPKAIAQFKKALEIQPDHVGSQYNLGAAYVNAALARDDSIAMLEKKGEVEAPDPSALAPSVGSDTLASDTAATEAAASDTAATKTAVSDTTTGPGTTATDTTRLQKRIEALVRRREDLFRKAIPPLERVRKTRRAADAIRRDACRALMVAYVQINRPNRAARVEECTDFAQADL